MQPDPVQVLTASCGTEQPAVQQVTPRVTPQVGCSPTSRVLASSPCIALVQPVQQSPINMQQRLVHLAESDPGLALHASELFASAMLHSVRVPALLSSSHEVHPALLLAVMTSAEVKAAESGNPDCVTLTPAALTDISCRIAQPFTIDCSTHSLPTVPLACPNACTSVKQVLDTNLAGHTVYMHAPTSVMPALVQHYKDCKTVAPAEEQAKTSGVFVVSHFLYTKHPDLFSEMHVLQVYRKNMPVNLRHWTGRSSVISRTLTPLYVLYDGTLTASMLCKIVHPITNTLTSQPAPAAVAAAVPAPAAATTVPQEVLQPPGLCMAFKGSISGAAATIGLDTWCQGFGFIQPTFIQQHGFSTMEIPPLQVKLGDGASLASSSLACQVQIKIGSFTCLHWLLVMQVPSVADVLLGDAFLRHHKAHLNYDSKSLIINTLKRRFVISSLEAAQARSSYNRTPVAPPTVNTDSSISDPISPPLLTAIQFNRARKKGGQILFCLVQIEGEAQAEHQALPTADPHDYSKTHPAVTDIIQQYPDVFPSSFTISELRDDMPEVIPTDPTKSIPNRPMFRYSPTEDKEIQAQVKALLEQGLIRPSTSPYGAPVLLVSKPDGTWRMCIDYRALNQITTKNSYPLPRIDDLLDRIQGAKYFSTLDLMSGYHQLRLRDSDVIKTAFKTTVGLYEYRVLSFGLTNAPSVFQAVMNKIFSTAGILGKFVLVYMDDILIISKTEEEHLQHLENVFEILRKEGLSCKFKKCNFFKQQLKFLGHVISADGISPDQEKIEAVKQWPLPKNQTELRGFLGLTNYFRKFIHHYSQLATPLTNLTRKELGPSVLFDQNCLDSFQKLKEALMQAPLLATPNFDLPFRMVTDASQVGLGGVLLQDDKPIAYESKKLTTTEMNYSTTDRELYAVVHCLKKWKVYMFHNSENLVITDHKPNSTLPTKTDLSSRQVRWIEFLQQFPGKWIYEKGNTNVADPLSRFNTFYLAVLQLDSTPTTDQQFNPLQLGQLIPLLKQGYKQDPYYSDVTDLQEDNGLYFYKDRISVPDYANLRTFIITECHDSVFAGHMGKHKTIELVARWFYWPNLTADVTVYVLQCHTCQLSKSGKTSNQGLLQPLPVPDRPWWSVSVDFVTGLPMTNRGFDAILTITDRLTRLVHLIPTTTKCDAVEFAYLFTNHIISKHGCPGDIVSDRGSIFTGRFWTAVASALHMHLSHSTSFHPQSDGATEIVNKQLEQVLRSHCMHTISKWDDFLSMVEFAINNSYHASTKYTPFYLNYGMHPITPITVDTLKLSKVPAAAQWSQDLQTTLSNAKKILQLAKDTQKAYADAKRNDITFNIGDMVLLNTKNLNLQQSNRKLLPRWLGPFPISHKVSDVAFTLKLPDVWVKAKLHPTFHVSLLKPYRSDGKVHPPPPPLEIDGHLEYEVEDILQVRTKVTNRRKLKDGTFSTGRTRNEFLIKYVGYGYEHCTWEPESNLQNCQEILQAFWAHQAAVQVARDRIRNSTNSTPGPSNSVPPVSLPSPAQGTLALAKEGGRPAALASASNQPKSSLKRTQANNSYNTRASHKKVRFH